jgi:phosphotransferase system  glucose/maltose/N-acetylglucosamine-specific IIC component
MGLSIVTALSLPIEPPTNTSADNSMFVVSYRLISMIGKTKLLLIDVIITATVNIILIQKYGITGAVNLTMISLILLNLLYFLQARRYLSIVPLRRKMLIIFLVSLSPTALLIFFKINIFQI